MSRKEERNRARRKPGIKSMRVKLEAQAIPEAASVANSVFVVRGLYYGFDKDTHRARRFHYAEVVQLAAEQFENNVVADMQEAQHLVVPYTWTQKDIDRQEQKCWPLEMLLYKDAKSEKELKALRPTLDQVRETTRQELLEMLEEQGVLFQLMENDQLKLPRQMPDNLPSKYRFTPS